MNTNNQLREQVSALVDGEVADAELSVVLSALHQEENKQHWDVYHRIGDILNSDDLALPMSADFSEKFASRLASEPVFLPQKPTLDVLPVHKIGYAIAAMLAFALIIIPQFAGQDGAETSAPYFSGKFSAVNASAFNRDQPKTELATLSSTSSSASYVEKRPVSKNGQNMIRDPQVDSYLAAHQRYSNSMYSAVEYETTPINPATDK